MVSTRSNPFLVTAPVLLTMLTTLGSLAADTDLWKKEIQQIDDLLISQEWKKAEKRVRKLRDDMYHTVVGQGEGWLAMLAALDAVALAGQGSEHQARWMWGVSLQLFPDVKTLDLKRYGDVAEKLTDNYPDAADPDSVTVPEGSALIPPKKIKTPRPEFPPARRVRHRDVSLMVSCVVGADGRPYKPTIVNSAGEFTMMYSALEAMGRWRFEPASLGGQPVPVVYVLTVNFRVP